MTPLEILELATTLAGTVGKLLDLAKQHGATDEQLAEARMNLDVAIARRRAEQNT